ncbi:MAG: glucose PTS transporter subunit IIA [Longibaculum sp.]
MNESKQEKYLRISQDLVNNVGGLENIQGVAHCATRLRIVLKNNDLANIEKLEDVDLVKGVFIAGDQLQLIFGAGLVNDVYEVFSQYTHTENMSLGDIKQQSTQKQNPFQAVIKSLSDVFIDIMPGILAAALLMGITGVLGKWDLVLNNETLYAINKLASIASNGIFAILPMAVCYSACKRYGGKPILGLIVGAIMLDASLANAYSVGSGSVTAEVIKIFGLPIELVGFQGGIIIALMMGFIVAKLDIFFDKKIPDVVKLLFSPLCTVFLSTVLLFTIIGPVGRELSNLITGGLIWVTQNLGALGYMIFAGVQQIIVITGLHHILGAIEAQLIADTGRNFLNPLMSVALIGQGGAVLGYLFINWKNLKARELCIPSFASTLFGISEPAIFGVNLRYKFPLVGGCLGGALAGAYVYFANLAAFGFGTTAVPGIAICDPANNGYFNYIIAHVIALVGGCVFTMIFGKIKGNKKEEKIEEVVEEMETTGEFTGTIEVISPIKGVVKNIGESSDATFASKVMGDGIAVSVAEGRVVAPVDGKVTFVFPSKHAIGITMKDGSSLLIHCGIDTVNMAGEGFETFVEVDQEVKKGDLLLTFDTDLVKEKGYSTETMMAFELKEGRTLEMKYTGESDGQDVVAIIR